MPPRPILGLALLLLLLELSLTSPTPTDTQSQSPFSVSKFHHCKLTYTVTYNDIYGPLFTENRYSCNLPPLPLPTPRAEGPHPRLHSLPTKHTITSYGCLPLPSSLPLNRHKYSNLFWGLSELTNQSCLLPGEAVEYVDIQRDWNADWRFTNVNRGEERLCDWYSELANIGRALHYFCFHTLGRPMEDEFSGGTEILAYGRDKPGGSAEGAQEGGRQLWCVRYSEKGWGTGVFDEKCLGVGVGVGVGEGEGA